MVHGFLHAFAGVDHDGAVTVRRLAELVQRLGRAGHPETLEIVASQLGVHTARNLEILCEQAPGHLVTIVLEVIFHSASALEDLAESQELRQGAALLSKAPHNSREAYRTLVQAAELLEDHSQATLMAGAILATLERQGVLGEQVLADAVVPLEQLGPFPIYGAPPLQALQAPVYDRGALSHYAASLQISTPQDVADEVQRALETPRQLDPTGLRLGLGIPMPTQHESSRAILGPYVEISPEEAEVGLRLRGRFGRLPGLFEG